MTTTDELYSPDLFILEDEQKEDSSIILELIDSGEIKLTRKNYFDMFKEEKDE